MTNINISKYEQQNRKHYDDPINNNHPNLICFLDIGISF